MAILFASNAALWNVGFFYRVALLGQAIFYLMAVVGTLSLRCRKTRIGGLTFYFVMSHVAMASALVFVLYLYVGFAAQTGWIASGFDESHRNAEYLAPGEQGYIFGTDFMVKDVFKMTLRGTTTALSSDSNAR